MRLRLWPADLPYVMGLHRIAGIYLVSGAVTMESLRRVPSDRLHVCLLLLLTFSTGIIDAVGYLGLDRVFTGNMTGNVVLLGMALTGAADLPVLRPALALIFFMLGAACAGRVLRNSHKEGWCPRTTSNLLIIGLGIAGLSATTAVFDVQDNATLGSVVTSILGLVMGIQAATARGLKIPDLTTVVVTSTITGLAADSSLAGGNNPRWARRTVAIMLILLGALAGAAAQSIGLWLGLAGASALTFAVAAIGHWKHRNELEHGKSAK